MDDAPPRLDPIEIVAGRHQLRPPAARDAADVLAIADDPDTRLWAPLRTVTDAASALAWCERWSTWNDGAAAQFGVYEITEGRLQGVVVLHRVDFANQSAEIGYTIAPWARGQGLAVTAVGSVLRWAFGALDLVRIQLLHASENVASCRVAGRLGFQLEGETRSSYRYGDGKLHDEHVHSLLVTD